MPFDATTYRGFGDGHDPAPTWGEHAACWAMLAVCATFSAAVGASAVFFVAAMASRYGADGAIVAAAVVAPMFWTAWMPLRHARALAAGRWP